MTPGIQRQQKCIYLLHCMSVYVTHNGHCATWSDSKKDNKNQTWLDSTCYTIVTNDAMIRISVKYHPCDCSDSSLLFANCMKWVVFSNLLTRNICRSHNEAFNLLAMYKGHLNGSLHSIWKLQMATLYFIL